MKHPTKTKSRKAPTTLSPTTNLLNERDPLEAANLLSAKAPWRTLHPRRTCYSRSISRTGRNWSGFKMSS
jgi:hypothetical protein